MAITTVEPGRVEVKDKSVFVFSDPSDEAGVLHLLSHEMNFLAFSLVHMLC